MTSVDELRNETADAVRRLSQAFAAGPSGGGSGRTSQSDAGDAEITSVSPVRQFDDTSARLLNQSLSSVTRAVNQFSGTVSSNTQEIQRATENDLTDLGRLLQGVLRDNRGGGLSGFLGAGLGLGSLIRSVAGAFGSDDNETEGFATRSVPPSISLELDNSGVLSGLPRVRHGQDGLPQPVAAAAPAPSQVIVQVNAMDSQSFMDRSSDIARAVRDAMLNMHPINDVINEI
jgi:hypothetical protein